MKPTESMFQFQKINESSHITQTWCICFRKDISAAEIFEQKSSMQSTHSLEYEIYFYDQKLKSRTGSNFS